MHTPLAPAIAEHFAAAEAARAAQRPELAARHLEAIVALDPRQAKALNSLGLHVLAAGDALRAVELLTRATAVDPSALGLWLNLANAQRATGDVAGEAASLDTVLAIEPYQVPALLQKALNRELLGFSRAASRLYGAVLSIVGTRQVPLALAAALDHGRGVIAAEQKALGAAVAPFVAVPRAGLDDDSAQRFDHCLDVLLGRAHHFPSTPTGLAYPGLPTIEFFTRASFPWLATLEAATPIIQREFGALVADAAQEFGPYVDVPRGSPVNQWEALNRSLDWSAVFLWKDGARVEANCARCPATAALLEKLPLLDIPGRAPAAFFSVLKAGAVIPPHVGVTNIRAVVHLPLIVPPQCGLRVGSQVREWIIGTALAFDDTIEHEAWNRSNEARAVLIVDVWNPHLTDAERAMVRAFYAAADATGLNPESPGAL